MHPHVRRLGTSVAAALFLFALLVSTVGSSGFGSSGSGFSASPLGPTLYVSPSGSGSACSAGAPCALATARAALSGVGSGTIVFLAGTYRQAIALALTSAENGQTWRNAPGAAPAIVGSIQIPASSFATYSGSILVASVPAGSFSRQLFVNGRRAQRAGGAASTYGTFTANATGWGGSNTVSTWPDILQAETHGIGGLSWTDTHCPITAATSSQLTVATNCFGVAASLGGYSFTYLENALELVTGPGMWFLDTVAWKLYYWPRPSDGTFAAADVELPIVSGPVLSVIGVTGVSLSGLTIDYGTWIPKAGDGHVVLQGANPYQTVASTGPYVETYTTGGASMASELMPANVLVSGSSGVSITGCTIAHMGAIALSVEASSFVTIYGNAMLDTSSTGINVGNINQTSDRLASGPRFTHDITVTNNFVGMTGAEYGSSPAIQTGLITNSTFANNEILYASYSGFMVGAWNLAAPAASWASNTYSQNRVQFCMHSGQIDGGCFYSTGPMTLGLGDTYSGNVLTNQGRAFGMQYVDNYSEGKSWIGNVVQIPFTGGICSAFFQWSPSYPAIYNTMTAWYANAPQSACSGDTPDPTNTVSVPTAIVTARDGAVLAQWNASGTSLRTPEIAFGKSTTASSTLSGQLTSQGNNSEGSVVTDYWASAAGDASPWWQADLAREYSVDTVEVFGLWGQFNAAYNRSFQAEVSDDPTFATYTAIGLAVDSAGYCPDGGGGVTPCVVSFTGLARGRYIRLAKYCAAGDGACTVNEGFGFAEMFAHGVP